MTLGPQNSQSKDISPILNRTEEMRFIHELKTLVLVTNSGTVFPWCLNHCRDVCLVIHPHFRRI